MTLLDRDRVPRPDQDPAIPLVDVLVRRARPGAVNSVIVGGRLVYGDGAFHGLERDRILDEIAERLRRPRSVAEQARSRLAAALGAHVAAFYKGWG